MQALSTGVKTWSGVAFGTFLLLLTMAVPAWAAGPGRKPSEAPTIVPGVHYTGMLDNYSGNVNLKSCTSCSYGWSVDFWRLPPLVSHDRITVDWQLAQERPEYEGRMVAAENVIDTTWGEVFESAHNDFGYEYTTGPAFRVSGSGAAESLFTTQQTSSSGAYLEFAAYASKSEKTHQAGYEQYPYSFTLAAIQHYIGINFPPPAQIATNTPITAGASLATGAPVPDGMGFTLIASWQDSDDRAQSLAYTAQTSGGAMTFPLNLPVSAAGQKVTLTISRPADAEYQEARSEATQIKVVGPPPPPPPPPPGTATVGQVAKVKHGVALLNLSCTGGPCKGRFKLRSPYKEHRVTHTRGIRRVSVHKRIAVVGRSAFRVPANQSTTLAVPLSRKGRALLHKSRRGRLSVKLAGHGITSAAIVLEGPARHRPKRARRGHR